MKRKITREEIETFLKELDTRMKTWDKPKLDRAIGNGFAELNTVAQPFVMETTVDLKEYYDNNEYKFVINLTENSIDIYDMYLATFGIDEFFADHSEEKERDINRIYRDPKNTNLVNVNLSTEDGGVFDNAVVKYFYIPKAEFDDLYINHDVYLTLENAMAAAAYDMLHDTDSAGKKRAAMARTGTSIVDVYPTDFGQPGRSRMFPEGV